MTRGLLTSFVGHALLLFYALFDIHAAPPDLPPIIPIEATIITPSELTRLKQGDPTSKQMEAKAKEEPKEEPKTKSFKYVIRPVIFLLLLTCTYLAGLPPKLRS